VVICLERDVDLHMAQLMPLPLTVSCFSKIRIGFTFLVPAYQGSPGKRAVKRVYICMQILVLMKWAYRQFITPHALEQPTQNFNTTMLFCNLIFFVKSTGSTLNDQITCCKTAYAVRITYVYVRLNETQMGVIAASPSADVKRVQNTI